MYIACEQALQLWWAKRAAREHASEWAAVALASPFVCLCATLTWLLETPPPLPTPTPNGKLACGWPASKLSIWGRYREKSSLARSLPSRFSRTNRRACSQASLQANLNGALNQALGMGQTPQKQFSDKHSVVSFNFSGLWTHLCPSRPPTGMCSACYCIKRINDMSFDLKFLSRSHQKTLVIFREGRQLKT